MKKLLIVLLCCIILTGCSVKAMDAEFYEESNDDYTVSRITFELNEENEVIEAMNGIWISQFDMHPIYRDGSKQRTKDDYIKKVEAMVLNLKRDGFNTIFLQLRPNGDSMFESDIYPLSKYIAGVYGGKIDYDAIEIFLNIAKENQISVHAWINPFRLCTQNELVNHGKGKLYEWYKQGVGKRIELGNDGILYLDPSYEEATDLIISGVNEILAKYNFDGIHIDDYFYPTEFEFEDEAEFKTSGFDNKGDFRRSNINRTVKAIYDEAHRHNKIFGVSPAGNIYSLSTGWYVDIYKWCSKEGFTDYVMPQLYFGFNNKSCPFEQILRDWEDAVTCEKVKLYIGLSAAKCELGSQGEEDKYAGELGKFEWRDNKDILARSYNRIKESNKAEGFCIFAYSSFYNPLSGEDNPFTIEEKTAFCQLIKNKGA